MKKHYLLCFILFLFFAPSKIFSQGSTFTFTTTGTNPTIDTALAYVGNIWGDYLNSTVPIKVNVYYINLFGTTLGITVPNGRRDFPTAPVDSVWYPSCLANAIEGTELNVGEADMDIFMDNSTNWYFGLDGNCPLGKYDFVTVMLHEIGHGLGFLSLAKLEGDTLGSFGEVTPADIAPLITSFPFPELNSKYSIFAHFMENGSGQSIVDTILFPNSSNILGDQFKSNAVYFAGPLSVVLNSGNPVRLFAPTTYESGSSMQHLNESTFSASNPNTLMTPYVGTSEEHHTPGPLTIAILEDIGWNVNHDVGNENMLSDLRIELFPNPVENYAMIRLDKSLENSPLEVIDMYGRVVLSTVVSVEKGNYFSVDFTSLSKGVYTIRLADGLLKLIKN